MSMKRKRDVSSQELNRHLATATATAAAAAAASSSSNHQMATIQPPSRKKLKKTPFIQSLPLNSISVNKNYPFVFYLIKLSLFFFFL